VSLDLERYVRDPVAFITECLVDPETNAPFVLYPAQVDFLRAALTLTDDGRLPAPEIVFGAIKKSGKTALAAMCMLYIILVLAGPYGEGFCVANDLEQAQGRVFTAIERIIKASPMLRGAAVITNKKILFPSTGATIEAIASDYAGAAGSNAHFVCFDELWAFTTESSRRLWDELVPPPTRRVTARLTTTYAGFEGESELLEGLYRRGKKGKKIAPGLYRAKGLVMAWHHKPIAPWQTDDWLDQMREQLRPNAYIRMIENRFVTSESTFVDMDWWDACVDREARPVLSDPTMSVYFGLDGSTKHDQSAIVGCSFDKDTKKVRMVYHRIFRPSPKSPLDFEATIEQSLLDLRGQFLIRRILFDPYQLASVSQRLTKGGLPMEEYPQTSNRLEEMGSNLYELIKHRNLVTYPDADVRLAVSRSVAVETPRGWKITKEKTSHKIDVVVALAMAALGAVEGQATTGSGVLFDEGPTSPQGHGQQVQVLMDRYALSPNDTFSGYLERLPEW
jgi:hypothetical protein